MLIVVEIGMLIFGIYALVTGKMPLNGKNIVRGAAARWLGALALVPLPLAFAVRRARANCTGRSAAVG